jgi:hypothetical protein
VSNYKFIDFDYENAGCRCISDGPLAAASAGAISMPITDNSRRRVIAGHRKTSGSRCRLSEIFGFTGHRKLVVFETFK